MATSSGNSTGSTQILNSGSEEDLQVSMLDERKRKRMLSNRESARRSRMRKQKHLDDLIGQVAQLKKENNNILSNINLTSQQYANVEAENSVLRAQMIELSQRLQSLNEILSYINSNNNNNNNNNGVFETHHHYQEDMMNNSWNLMYVNQPIMASADMLYQY
ncbi:bZIP transcription factor 44-like [Nicotiana tabacum]|uniref:BZIP transcription factor 44-like n=2 Tax=Nicotiana TaxID=4085 RepID=A0A1S3YXX1_TOBAC|nr:PREDICTED: ocs element-binding factor 1-like [Nicotiana sylvestris]XP_016457191.1 PREDICTED: bZIP transcription factor 53-like [Nicotiana tabacum]